MDTDAHAPRGTASDSLMTQIDVTNVRQVRAVLLREIDSVQQALRDASDLRAIPRCGDDPVSIDAQRMFQAQINHILDTHKAWVEELREACERLDLAAQEYGLVEERNATSFRHR
ncbi:hypothetical protein GCM10009613_38640 [Pseudonocardia kongjuensis]|uniref:PE family protein n=1 Tax=Pseudonocardia kongjuensis TaxID=102227 RepID=A0ABN1XYA8_9PSEU